MAERLVKIGTPQETLNEFVKEAPHNLFISKYVGEWDSGLVGKALVEAGFMQEGDGLTVTFEVDPLALPNSLSRKAKIYTARRISKDKVVPTSFLGEFDLDIECSNDN